VFFENILSLAEQLLGEARKHQATGGGLQAVAKAHLCGLASAVAVLHTASSVLEPLEFSSGYPRNGGAVHSREDEGGNLQRKFDRVASAGQAVAKASSATTPGVLIAAAIRAPALSESQCLAAWGKHRAAAVTPGDGARASGPQAAVAGACAAWRYAGVLSQVLALSAAYLQSSRAEAPGQSAPLTNLLSICGEAGARLFRMLVLFQPAPQEPEDESCACVRQVLSVFDAILDHHPVLEANSLGARWSLTYMFECMITSSGR
jgi:hypothetical protein